MFSLIWFPSFKSYHLSSEYLVDAFFEETQNKGQCTKASVNLVVKNCV